MRILIGTEQWFPDYVGGTARVARETAFALAGRGHHVSVVAPASVGKAKHERCGYVDVHRVVPRSVLPKTWSDAALFRRHLAPLVDSHDVLLLHHAIIAAAMAFRRSSIPIAYVFHASPLREARHRRASGISTSQQIKSLAVEPVLALAEALAASRCDAILALSNFSRDLIVSDHPLSADRIRLVSGGVNTKAHSPSSDRDSLRRDMGLGPGELLLLTVRRLVPRMGVENLVRAMAELKAVDRRSLRLFVVGDGELRRRLEVLTHELGMSSTISFLGAVSDEQVQNLYRAADLFLLPTTAYEGFGIATVEALASGTPVVGTPGGATPEILGPLDRDLLALDASPAGLAAAIRRGLDLSTASFRDVCRGYAERHFAWETVIVGWEEALRGLVR